MYCETFIALSLQVFALSEKANKHFCGKPLYFDFT